MTTFRDHRIAKLDADAELLGARLEAAAARLQDLGHSYEALARTMAGLGTDITATAEVLGRMIEGLSELRRELQ